MIAPRSARALLAALLTLDLGCAARTLRSPEALRDAYAAALERDDPDAAYALLAPELQAELSLDQFRARWAADAADREASAADLAALPDDLKDPIPGGTTVHSNGAVLAWSAASGEYQVVAGLPELADLSTPTQAIRSFIAAIRAADLAALEVVVSEELRARLAGDWEARAAAIEARLAEPGAIELSADSRQALLRYDTGRAIALEQSPEGWKITSFQ